MPRNQMNSMAALLSSLVTLIFWMAIVLGGIFLGILAIGLAGSINGGALVLPFVAADVGDVPPGRLLAALVSLVVFAPGIAFICFQLRRILSTLAEGDPFVPDNSQRLSHIAWAIAWIELVRMGSLVVLSKTVDLGPGYEANINVNLAVWGAVIVLFVLAQVFKEGTRLREEEKMTI